MISSEQNKEETTPETNQEELDLQVDFTTSHDYIASAFQAIAAVADIDTAIMSRMDEMRVKRIRRKSLLIIDSCIEELYNEIFETDIE